MKFSEPNNSKLICLQSHPRETVFNSIFWPKVLAGQITVFHVFDDLNRVYCSYPSRSRMKFRRYRYNLTVHNRFIGTRVDDYFDNEKRDTRRKNPEEIRDFCCVVVFNLTILITLKQCDRNATFATIKFDKLN